MLSILLGALVCTSDGAADVFSSSAEYTTWCFSVYFTLCCRCFSSSAEYATWCFRVYTSHCAASATSSAGAAGGTS